MVAKTINLFNPKQNRVATKSKIKTINFLIQNKTGLPKNLKYQIYFLFKS